MEPVIHRHLIDRLAFANGIISGIALYPQVWNVVTTGTVSGISAVTYLLILVNSLIWILYAIHRGLLSLGIASLLNAVASSILLMVMLLVS
jgi:uncharacterized protein with PQ loop repeat